MHSQQTSFDWSLALMAAVLVVAIAVLAIGLAG